MVLASILVRLAACQDQIEPAHFNTIWAEFTNLAHQNAHAYVVQTD